VVLIHGVGFASLSGKANLAAGAGNRQRRFGCALIIPGKMRCPG
jgi:hypothetical protein